MIVQKIRAIQQAKHEKLIATAIVENGKYGQKHDIDVEVFLTTKWLSSNLGSFVFKVTYCEKHNNGMNNNLNHTVKDAEVLYIQPPHLDSDPNPFDQGARTVQKWKEELSNYNNKNQNHAPQPPRMNKYETLPTHIDNFTDGAYFCCKGCENLTGHFPEHKTIFQCFSSEIWCNYHILALKIAQEGLENLSPIQN